MDVSECRRLAEELHTERPSKREGRKLFELANKALGLVAGTQADLTADGVIERLAAGRGYQEQTGVAIRLRSANGLLRATVGRGWSCGTRHRRTFHVV